jgi:hypothetical protein
MRRSSLLLLSLSANFALAGWIAWRVANPADPAPQATAAEFQPAEHEEPPLLETNAPIAIITSRAPTPFHWSQVESTNYVTYIANLRAIHCPERVIRWLISKELADEYIKQRQLLFAPWQGLIWDEVSHALHSPEKWLKQMEPSAKAIEKADTQLKEDTTKLLKSLLGNAPPEVTPIPPEPPRVPDALAGYLPEEKQRQIQDIDNKYGKLISEVYQNRQKSSSDPGASASELNRQKLSEIQAVLTAEEFNEYRLRTSNASGLRHRVYNFEATPEELRELARKQMEFDEAHPHPEGDSPKARAQREEWQKTRSQLDEQYKSVLGTDRFAAFKRSQDGDFQAVLKVVERCELPAAYANQVFDVKRAFEESARQLRENTALTEEERAAAQEVIRQATERTVRQTLGDRAFQTYQRYGGDWLGRKAQP